MNKVYRYFEYAYLVIAAFFTYETIMLWNKDRSQAYLFSFFVILAIFMFFFKRRFRKRIEKRNQQ
ncbi:hypothetical protein FT993_09285 [Mesonia sp. HuA40]|nr:hypothetical protein [Mesonia sp. HuA40]TXK71584.1 hypothetical protein FT993_09285 [Mesonia sp. HuA40]